MNCEQFREQLLTDYLNEEMKAAQKTEWEAHCQQCEACREYFAFVKRSLTDPLTRAQDLPVPPGLWKNIQNQIQEEKEQVRGYTRVHGIRLFWEEFFRAWQQTRTLVTAMIVLMVLNMVAFGAYLSRAQGLLAYTGKQDEVWFFVTENYTDFVPQEDAEQVDFFDNVYFQ